MREWKFVLRDFLRRRGFDIVRYRTDFGNDSFQDTRTILSGFEAPVVFDVGANVGQSIRDYKSVLPDARMHSFEASPTTFEKLQSNTRGVRDLNLWNFAVGSSPGTAKFLESTHPDMSSFLPPGQDGWGEVKRETEVPVVTLDGFTAEHGIDFVHVLKSDTQGFDFEVLKGAENLMREGRIALIRFECIFNRMYEDLPDYHEVLGYLAGFDYSIAGFYDQTHAGNQLIQNDVLLIHEGFRKERNQSVCESAG